MLVVRSKPLTTLDSPSMGFALTLALDDSLAARRRAVPPGLQGPSLPERAALRRRGPLARAHRRGVPARHLPVVLRWRAHPLVVARPAHGALPGRAQGLALAAEDGRQGHLRDALRQRFSPGHAGM